MSENLLTTEKEENKPEEVIETKTEEVKTPAKFLDKETGELNVQALLKSYLALEKKLSQKSEEMPKVPASIEEYEIVCDNDYFNPDETINQQLLEKGFTQEQAQFVYDLAAEKMIPMIIELASCFQADKEKSRLEEKFGGKEKWTEVSRQLSQYGKSKLEPQVLEGLSSSYDGIMALYSMMMENAPAISVGDEAEADLTPDDLHKMMKDKKYWQQKDPAFISKVTEGFKKLYK